MKGEEWMRSPWMGGKERGRCDCACLSHERIENCPIAEGAHVKSRGSRDCTWGKCRPADLYFLSLQSLEDRYLHPAFRGAAVF